MDPVAIVLPIVGMTIPIVIVPTILGIRHARFLREVEHAERMRAMELGRTLPQDDHRWSPAGICVALGMVVPIGVFFCAWMASQTVASQDWLWRSAGIVGLAGVVSGSFIAHHHFNRLAAGRSDDTAAAKPPAYDPEAFEVVNNYR